MFKFQTLKVWQKSVYFTNMMFDVTDSLPGRYQYSLGDQLRRAGLSVSNNIAEAAGRRSRKEGSNFYNIAKGSVYECVNILVVISKRGLFREDKFDKRKIYNEAEEIAKMLTGLIRR